MNKQLRIDSAEANELADELARLTGEPVAEAVTRALRERIERSRRSGPPAELRTVEERIRAIEHIREQGRKFREKGLSSDHDWLYDEDGLPT